MDGYRAFIFPFVKSHSDKSIIHAKAMKHNILSTLGFQEERE